ncbi:L-rhamnose mutarotase (plasmid) [Hymenobacter tibetensis]|uniref:L-rhamnose mutarotase n=1 Tax=Hymenobacter tibetensis TaxID=497967 RepID=A0ABY4D4C2_9BACT|nr:L-rhamnose mutarotase [Hymenobacter tibetensis]UOG77373.1 L-rhamnose mutarotase [Hymenobacter tibetensis]
MEYPEASYPPQFKRYCKTLTLQDDAVLIEQYKQAHAPDVVWPVINQGLREVGVLKMEIYLTGRQLFMIMDTVVDFNHDQAMATLATMPYQAEWEAYVSQFQVSATESTAAEKWQLVERIYTLD